MSTLIEKVLLTITIDTECDHDQYWARSSPLQFESIYEGIPNRLQTVFNNVGAIPTYLLTVEVMENTQCLETLRNIQGDHELGTHLHAAFIEPEKNYQDYAGIDSPDFNLPIEKRLRRRGVNTVHYTSPTVWAWRQGRVRGIAKSTDLMLTLFPFEAKFYQQHSVAVAFVGHPLAYHIPLEKQTFSARAQLITIIIWLKWAISANTQVVCLLFG